MLIIVFVVLQTLSIDLYRHWLVNLKIQKNESVLYLFV